MRQRHRIGLALVVAATAGLLPVTTSSASGIGRGSDGLSGQAAIDALGSRLSTVAARAGWSAATLRHELATDSSLHLASATDSVFYVDAGVVDAAAGDGGGAGPQASIVPLGDTFTLHSRPGAPITVYLDATGHTSEGTGWNSYCSYPVFCPDQIVSAAMDTDGDPDHFTDAELELLQGIWARVADDYAVFDVDVTTQEPPLSDLLADDGVDGAARFGQRVVITSTNFFTGALGVAFVGLIGVGDTVDTPAFVFTTVNGCSWTDQANLCNAAYKTAYVLAHGATHEVGHTLGLHHDGTSTKDYYAGTPAWAPIMGSAGASTYATWSKGEYSGANNTEDDLAVMQQWGAPLLADTVGDSRPSAEPLTLTAAAFDVTGLISTRTDRDVYALDIDGHLNATLTPTAPFDPNLDAQLRLLDAAGNVLVTSNPANRAAPTISTDVADGRYYLEVDGVGQGNPAQTGYSDYSSLGLYDLSGTALPGDPTIGLPPVAVGAVSAGVGPLVMNFSSNGSFDPAAQPLTYLWTFGDGTSSTDPNPSHTYAKAGKFTAQLSVKDIGNQISAVQVNVVVADPAKQLAITTITGVRVKRGTVKVTVTVVDGYGKPVRSALVKGKWLNSKSTYSAYTNSKGVATLYRYTSKATSFTTTKVSKSARVWNGANVSASIAAF